MCFKISKVEFVEVAISDITLGEYEFPKQLTVLESGKILAIETFKRSTMPFAPSGKPVIADVPFADAFLLLELDNGRTDINKLPLSSLYVPGNNGVLREFADLKVSFSKSKVLIKDNTGLTNGDVVVFAIYYEKDYSC